MRQKSLIVQIVLLQISSFEGKFTLPYVSANVNFIGLIVYAKATFKLHVEPDKSNLLRMEKYQCYLQLTSCSTALDAYVKITNRFTRLVESKL